MIMQAISDPIKPFIITDFVKGVLQAVDGINAFQSIDFIGSIISAATAPNRAFRYNKALHTAIC